MSSKAPGVTLWALSCYFFLIRMVCTHPSSHLWLLHSLFCWLALGTSVTFIPLFLSSRRTTSLTFCFDLTSVLPSAFLNWRSNQRELPTNTLSYQETQIPSHLFETQTRHCHDHQLNANSITPDNPWSWHVIIFPYYNIIDFEIHFRNYEFTSRSLLFISTTASNCYPLGQINTLGISPNINLAIKERHIDRRPSKFLNK